MAQMPSLREPGKRERKRKERKAGRGLFLKGLRVTFQRIKVSNISIEPVLKPVDKRLYREEENKTPAAVTLHSMGLGVTYPGVTAFT